MTKYQVRKRTAKNFLQFFSLKCCIFQEKCKTCNFSADRFRKWENSLGTNMEHMQSRCMVGGAKKKLHSLLSCWSACARLLVHVRCPLTDLPLYRLDMSQVLTAKQQPWMCGLGWFVRCVCVCAGASMGWGRRRAMSVTKTIHDPSLSSAWHYL